MDAIDVNTADPQAETQQKQAIVPTLLSVVGSVAGALVASTFSESPSYNWIGAILGAALPPLIAVAGPFSHLRLTAGFLVIGVALFVTYSGFAVQARVTGSATSILPGPDPKTTSSVKSIAPTPTSSPTVLVTCEGQLCIRVTPILLHCSNDGCDSDITVKSTGTKVLRVTGFEFEGAAAGRFHQDSNCVDAGPLTKNETCTIAVRLDPGPAGTARLRIHQNLKGPASLVALVAAGADPPSDGGDTQDLSFSTVSSCQVDPGGASNGGDKLTISVAVLNSNDQNLAQLVPFSLTSDTGLNGGGNAQVSTGSGSAPMTVALGSADYSQVHHFTLTLDPEGKIPETNESNNSLEVRVDLPTRPDSPSDVPCTTN
ncbi:hypothetical protein ACIA58_22790 [Kribbella sp. NPDC051586]|uniref:hypothetical protein n=1 Tax=Kribbella sp. NPDC051586 TaxID=3364118 RepID=UPI0037B0C062